MNIRIKNFVDLIKDRGLRKKVVDIIENPQIRIGSTTYSGLPLEASPAGLSRHHSYPGGFIEHVIATSRIALALCDVVEEVYSGKVDRDQVLVGTILHDIFKPLTYAEIDGGYMLTKLGERLDHLTLVASELIRRSFALDIVHIVCAHHGGQAGPTWPRTVEALICHLADSTDSQLSGEVLRAARYLSRKVSGEEPALLTSKEAFEIVHSKTVEGWEGVDKTVQNIKREKPY